MDEDPLTSDDFIGQVLGKPSREKKMFSFGPPSPQFGQLVPLSLNVENDVLAGITYDRTK